MSDGVTGSDGGGGRLMRVGVDILFSGIIQLVSSIVYFEEDWSAVRLLTAWVEYPERSEFR